MTTTVDQAKQIVALSAQVDAMTALVANLKIAVDEHWPISTINAYAPATSSSAKRGTALIILPFGDADDTMSQLALNTALTTYQSQLDALNAQLSTLLA